MKSLRATDADGIGSGDLPVSVLVDQEYAGKLTQAAAAGTVSLVQVSGNGG
ncbi:hypothetical protein NKH77_23275 [Streptomyces sp. M19]